MGALMPSPKYPGRSRVMSREDAGAIRYEQYLAEERPQSRFQCENPHLVHGIGLPSMFGPDVAPMPVEIEARCRKCASCLMHRARLWTARGVDEVTASTRTWFGTLTVRPEDRFMLRVKARARTHDRASKPFDQMNRSEQFGELAWHLGRECTTFLKRVRAQSAAPLRYLLVYEAHKSGDPHAHILIHEQGVPVTKQLLERQWKLGFSHWRLTGDDPRAAFYACKYLSKEALTRVRASLRYGQPTLVRQSTKRTLGALATLREAKRSTSGE